MRKDDRMAGAELEQHTQRLEVEVMAATPTANGAIGGDAAEHFGVG